MKKTICAVVVASAIIIAAVGALVLGTHQPAAATGGGPTGMHNQSPPSGRAPFPTGRLPRQPNPPTINLSPGMNPEDEYNIVGIPPGGVLTHWLIDPESYSSHEELLARLPPGTVIKAWALPANFMSERASMREQRAHANINATKPTP